jgi:TolA-binding protein
MSNNQGGINIGNVGGDLLIEAGGDIVGGDKTTTTTITTGFKQEQDKQEFIQQIEELRQQLRQVKSEIENAEGIDEDEKDAIVLEVMQQVKALKTAKDEAEQLDIQQEPSKEKREAIETPLNATGGIISKVTTIFDKASDVGGKIRNIKHLLPILMATRHLFGLP